MASPKRKRRAAWRRARSSNAPRGDRVLKKGGVARNLFVVLDGTLEVRDDDGVHAVFGAGDVFGEMAFLLERPRTRDV